MGKSGETLYKEKWKIIQHRWERGNTQGGSEKAGKARWMLSVPWDLHLCMRLRVPKRCCLDFHIPSAIPRVGDAWGCPHRGDQVLRFPTATTHAQS